MDRKIKKKKKKRSQDGKTKLKFVSFDFAKV